MCNKYHQLSEYLPSEPFPRPVNSMLESNVQNYA